MFSVGVSVVPRSRTSLTDLVGMSRCYAPPIRKSTRIELFPRAGLVGPLSLRSELDPDGWGLRSTGRQAVVLPVVEVAFWPFWPASHRHRCCRGTHPPIRALPVSWQPKT